MSSQIISQGSNYMICQVTRQVKNEFLMSDLVLQCTLNGNHALQMHLQHEKNDN